MINRTNIKGIVAEALKGHGTAVAKDGYEDEVVGVKAGDKGLITAYLPEQDTFAVFWGKGKWVTYKQTEEEFNSMFEVQLDNA